jgi:hypothetical protein
MGRAPRPIDDGLVDRAPDCADIFADPDDHSKTPTNVGPAERAVARPYGSNGSRGRSTRPATPGQVKAIYAIARAQHADLEALLKDDHGVDRPEDLSLAEASKFIDQIKAAANI